MLQNAPTLAIVAVDTDENELSKVRQVTNRIRRNIGMGGTSLEWSQEAGPTKSRKKCILLSENAVFALKNA